MVNAIIAFLGDKSEPGLDQTAQFMQVNVYIKADVLTPALAQKKATTWLAMNAGHLLLAENPELLLQDPLQWRFDVIYTVPQRHRPGTVRRSWLGRMQIDAATGEVQNADQLVEELTANANALAVRAA